MLDETVFPDWLEPLLVSDDVFGSAYEAVDPQARAWMKTAIATQHACHGARSVQWGRQEQHWRQGFVTVGESRPVAWTVLLLSESSVSAIRMLAGLMPALLAGVSDVLVVRVADEATPWPQDLLAALELAGQELAVTLPSGRVADLAASMAEQGAGRWLCLGAPAASLLPVQESPQQAIWREPQHAALAVAGDVVDTSLLAWAHPDLRLERLSGGDETLTAALESGDYAAFAGDTEFLDVVPDSVPLMLGPGQEGCWLWAGLAPDWFLQHRISLVTEL